MYVSSLTFRRARWLTRRAFFAHPRASLAPGQNRSWITSAGTEPQQNRPQVRRPPTERRARRGPPGSAPAPNPPRSVAASPPSPCRPGEPLPRFRRFSSRTAVARPRTDTARFACCRELAAWHTFSGAVSRCRLPWGCLSSSLPTRAGARGSGRTEAGPSNYPAQSRYNTPRKFERTQR